MLKNYTCSLSFNKVPRHALATLVYNSDTLVKHTYLDCVIIPCSSHCFSGYNDKDVSFKSPLFVLAYTATFLNKMSMFDLWHNRLGHPHSKMVSSIFKMTLN